LSAGSFVHGGAYHFVLLPFLSSSSLLFFWLVSHSSAIYIAGWLVLDFVWGLILLSFFSFSLYFSFYLRWKAAAGQVFRAEGKVPRPSIAREISAG